MTAVEYILNLVVGEDEQGKDVRVKDIISKSEIAKAKEMENEQRIKDIDFGHGNPSWVNINYETYFELSNKHELNKSE